MSAGSILSIGLQAMQTGINRSNTAGAQIAAKGVEGESLAQNLVELRQGELHVKAGANIVKTGDEMLGTLIDIRA